MNGKRCRALRNSSNLAGRPAKRAYINGRVSKAQCPKLATDTRSRKPKAPRPKASSEWKRTGPLIVVHPRRRTDKDHRNDVVWCDDPSNTEALAVYGTHPKWELDALALRHPLEDVT